MTNKCSYVQWIDRLTFSAVSYSLSSLSLSRHEGNDLHNAIYFPCHKRSFLALSRYDTIILKYALIDHCIDNATNLASQTVWHAQVDYTHTCSSPRPDQKFDRWIAVLILAVIILSLLHSCNHWGKEMIGWTKLYSLVTDSRMSHFSLTLEGPGGLCEYRQHPLILNGVPSGNEVS